MGRKVSIEIDYSGEEFERLEECPLKNLLAAVMRHALLDITRSEEREHAYQWFLSTQHGAENGFTCSFVCDHLDICKRTLQRRVKELYEFCKAGHENNPYDNLIPVPFFERLTNRSQSRTSEQLMLQARLHRAKQQPLQERESREQGVLRWLQLVRAESDHQGT